MSTENIKNTINSTKKTKVITNAMYLVAASRLGKTQERMAASKPYAEKMREVIGHVAHRKSEYKHPYLTPRKNIKKIGVILITSDRGLCGGLNSNLLKLTVKQLKDWQEQGIDNELSLMGNKGLQFVKQYGGNVTTFSKQTSTTPSISDCIGLVQQMLTAYRNESVDQIWIASNTFINAMIQKPCIRQLVPTPPADMPKSPAHWEYLYEPNAQEVLDLLLTRYIESQVYQAVIENIACEQAARMLAMKNATDNAEEIIKDLKLVYNKARQAAITQEIAEIISGSDAL